MNKKKYFYVIVFITIISLALIAAKTIPEDGDFINHKVKKGETVSLLCIEIYGYYSNELGIAFAKDNPSVKNINLINIDQELFFRKPITDKTKVTKDTKDTTAVFYKKVNATQGVVTYVEGQAKLTKKGATTSKKLSANVVVSPGDLIKTGDDGRVELIINRETVVRMKENTELTIDAFRDLATQEGKTSLDFSLGSVWSKVKKFKDNISRFELEMPTAIAGVHGTVYQTTVGKDKSAEVKVYDGEVAVNGKSNKKDTDTKKSNKIIVPQEVLGPQEVAGPKEISMDEWTKIVRAMQSIKIDKNGVPTDPTNFKKSPDDSWVKWNEERDKRIAEMFEEL